MSPPAGIGTIKANNAMTGAAARRGRAGAAVIRGIGLIRSSEDWAICGHLGARHAGVSQGSGRPQFGVLTEKDSRQGSAARRGDRHCLLLARNNPSQVLEGVHAKVERSITASCLRREIVPYLDRTDLVRTTVHTSRAPCSEGMGLVILILLAFLGSARSALIVALTVPFRCSRVRSDGHDQHSGQSVVFGRHRFRNLVNGAIVVLENVLAAREERPRHI